MRIGLITIGVILIAGGVAGLLRPAPYHFVEQRGVTLDLPSEKQKEPIDVRPVNLRRASWAGIVTGVLVLAGAAWSKGLRTPQPHDQPPVESQPYV